MILVQTVMGVMIVAMIIKRWWLFDVNKLSFNPNHKE